ncbi:unnamed protein product [Haemonchus placei]|uniref:Uncharacterized protein n=1 Tax=Haemonchus placei TaxID=6290 RepID=A0A3P7W4W5_HAEPC|nr:unnamed protein product [Haemonchus placei]
MTALVSALWVAGTLYLIGEVIVLVIAFGLALSYFIRWRLKVLLRAMKNVEVSAQNANRALLRREALSFGKDEERRLISAFYTEEMHDLVYSPVDSESPHITQRGVGTLLDLYILHRSEVLRLFILSLLRVQFSTAFLLVFRLIFKVNAKLNSFIANFDALQVTLSQRNRNRLKTSENEHEPKKYDGMEKVVLSLDDIANGITNKQLSPIEVKRALQRILLMDVFYESGSRPSAEGPPSYDAIADSEANVKNKSERLTGFSVSEGEPPCDKVYEVIASPEDVDESDTFFGDVTDFATQEKSNQLMEELRAALADRATEFAARERRALAAFYGVSDEELGEIEKKNEKNESAAPPEKFSSDDVEGCEQNDDEAAENISSRTARTLPPDLLAALRLRSVLEETIGDEDD